MESSSTTNFRIPVLLVLYDFRYLWKDNREVFVKKGEKLFLLEKTNKDWWQVLRPTEKKSFFVPAQYVEILENERPDIASSSSGIEYSDSVLYENLESLKQQVNFELPNISSFHKSNEETALYKERSIKKLPQDICKLKPVPKTRTKVSNNKNEDECAEITKSNISDPKNSYLQCNDFYKCDKSDKSKLNDKKSHNLTFSKESNSLDVLQSDIKNCRGKNVPVAVENLVYCNVPVGEGKNLLTKHRMQSSVVQNKVNIDIGKNRMKNSYNLKAKPFKNGEPNTKQQKPIAGALTSMKHETVALGKEKLKFSHHFSKSLEKLAEEIQFEPKKVDVGAKSLSVDNYSKTRSAIMPKDIFEKEEKKGKTNDASVVLDEIKVQPQSKSVFSRFRRSLHHSSSFKSNNLKKLGKNSKKACELSLSWEGGLDKIQEKKEKEEKPQVTPPALQRSRTFMFAERSPLSNRPANRVFSVKHRLDTAYHSQRKAEEKVTLSTFKPIFNIDGTTKPFDPVKKLIHKEISDQCTFEKEKLHPSILEVVKSKTADNAERKKETNFKFKSDSERNKPTKIMSGHLPPYENVSKVHPKTSASEIDINSKTSGQKSLAFYNEPYSNSDSDDNLEEKSLALIANKSLKSQSSVESNLTVSEGTEASESDENDSLEFKTDLSSRQSSDQPVNKRRTSLVRSSRVESTKARKVTARLPPTPPPEQKPLKDLGDGWGAYFSNGRSYYYNEITGEKNWKPPRKSINAQEKRLVGSHESLSSDIYRSDTSSPLNENYQFLNSLNHSSGSLKSTTVDSASFETPNSGLARSWKEGSPDDLNRSSYNSSPIAGLSQSSAYSFNKSSHDSLNRFSPIENIPSEEEGLELQDHVYQDVYHSSKEGQLKLEKEWKSKSVDTSTFRTKPGWEEFYDEKSDQIYYTYKDKKEKVGINIELYRILEHSQVNEMWAQKLSFIPLNVALWLQNIRKTVEGEDNNELHGNTEKSKRCQSMSSSNDSVYDNVIFSLGKADLNKPTSLGSLERGIERNISIATRAFLKSEISKDLCATWPLRKYPKKLFELSLGDLPKHGYKENETNSTSLLKNDNQIIHFDSTENKLSTKKRDITCGRRELSESQSQEREEPNLRTWMSNLLASHREKHTEECSWTWLNAEEIVCDNPSEDVQYCDTLSGVENDGVDFEERISLLFSECDSGNKIELDNCFEGDKVPKSLPDVFSCLEVNDILKCAFVPQKPPVPPRQRKRKMSEKYSPQFSVAQNRRLRKTHLAKAKAVAIPKVQLRIKNFDADCHEKTKSDSFKNKFLPVINVGKKDEFADKIAKKPLPFPSNNPELEYEISELLMMQRVTESSKVRRRVSANSKASPILEESIDIFQGCTKNIFEAQQSPFSIQSSCKMSNEKMFNDDLDDFISDLSSNLVDVESRDKVKQFLMSKRKKIQCHIKPRLPVKLREDIIIDWENDYENLNEPVILEGKSVAGKKIPNVRLWPKRQINVESDCQSLGTSTSKDCSDDETYGKIVEDFDLLTNASSTEGIFSLISDSSQPSESNFEENQQDVRNLNKVIKGIVGSDITEIVTRYDKILKENDPKCDTETSDKISFSSISEGLNSYSDFESDINEAIAIGEIWYNEKLSEENASVISWDISEDISRSSDRCIDDDAVPVDDDRSDASKSWKLFTTTIEHKFETGSVNTLSNLKLDTITEDEDKSTESYCVELEKDSDDDDDNDKSFIKSSSETNLVSLSRPKPTVEKLLSKSVDFFRDSLTEDRLGLNNLILKKHDSITSDICEWMARIRGIAFAEDQLFSNDEEWILSFDSEERAYFFEETTKKSLWALPDYSRENTKPEYVYPIQRSATESAINNETSAKLRLSKDGGQARISASTRSSKAQSMLIEPKPELSRKDGSKTFSMPRDLSKIYGEIIRIGVLNKTKILENGKKLRKNWTPSFTILTDSYLFFFKDAKSFQNMKHVMGSNSNHMCLSLQGAVIEKRDNISSRKNVYKISCSDNTEVLIQTEKPSDAEEWFKEISSVIQNLPQDPAIKDSPILDSKSPSKVGRTKSLKVRSKDTGSMEDLNSTPEERQNKVKARLKKFFIRRPTVDSLKKKGIWKDEPVFGCSLEQITKNRNPRVPVFVEKCIECIESKEENMKTDGLYRASGNLSQVQKIRLEVDQNNLNIMKEEEDVHVLTGSLKLFFRELKEPLIPSKQLEPALLATDKHTRKERIKDFQKIVKSLPTPNYDTLKFLLQHLLRVKEYHKFNRMNINNLAIVFGPTLMWPEQESANMALELMQQNVVIECLLKEFQEIFT